MWVLTLTLGGSNTLPWGLIYLQLFVLFNGNGIVGTTYVGLGVGRHSYA